MTRKCHSMKSFSTSGIAEAVYLNNDKILKCLDPSSGITLYTQIESKVSLVSGGASSYTRAPHPWSIFSNSYHWNLATLSSHLQLVHQRRLCRQVPLCGHVWLAEGASKVQKQLRQPSLIYLHIAGDERSCQDYQSLTTAVGSNYWGKVCERPYLVRALERLEVFQFNWD